jgi:hypothetical protein
MGDVAAGNRQGDDDHDVGHGEEGLERHIVPAGQDSQPKLEHEDGREHERAEDRARDPPRRYIRRFSRLMIAKAKPARVATDVPVARW